MSRRLPIATADGTVKDTQRLVIAKNGLAKEVQRALVSCEGVLREFWPPVVDVTDPDPRIVWGGGFLNADNVTEIPTDALCFFRFDDDGVCSYTEYPPAQILTVSYLNPPVTAIGQYVIKCDQSTGVISGDPLGVWIQLEPGVPIEWNVPNTDDLANSLRASGPITVARDNGAGAPVGGTEVIRNCTWHAEQTGSGGVSGEIVWSEVEWFLAETKANEIAECEVIIQTDGISFGLGDDNDPIEENWSDAPNGLETVSVTLISGTAPTGPALDTPHVIDQDFTWSLPTAGNIQETVSCVIDVTILSDFNGITKRVNMDSITNVVVDNQNVWGPGDPLVIVDIAFSTAAQATLRMNSNGLIEGEGLNSGPAPLSPMPWHADAPNATNPEEYEFRLDLSPGSAVADDTSVSTGVWIPGVTPLEWNWTVLWNPVTAPDIKNAVGTLGVRLAGQPSTETYQDVQIQINTEQVGP